MRYITIAISLVILLLAIPAQAQTVTAAQTAEIENVLKEQVSKYFSVWDTLNAEAVMKFWSRKKIIGQFVSRGLESDLEAILNSTKVTMANVSTSKYEISDTVVYAFSPETALSSCKGLLRIEYKNGAISNYNAAATMIWIKEAGDWKISYYSGKSSVSR